MQRHSRINKKKVLFTVEIDKTTIVPIKEGYIKYTTYNENGKILKLCRCEICDVEFELTGKRKCKACIRKSASLF